MSTKATKESLERARAFTKKHVPRCKENNSFPELILAAEFDAVRLARDREVRERLRELPKIEAMLADDTGCDWIPLHLVLEILLELEAKP
jgi:hypothetical protein